jgi:hypothetical protein
MLTNINFNATLRKALGACRRGLKLTHCRKLGLMDVSQPSRRLAGGCAATTFGHCGDAKRSKGFDPNGDLRRTALCLTAVKISTYCHSEPHCDHKSRPRLLFVTFCLLSSQGGVQRGLNTRGGVRGQGKDPEPRGWGGGWTKQRPDPRWKTAAKKQAVTGEVGGTTGGAKTRRSQRGVACAVSCKASGGGGGLYSARGVVEGRWIRRVRTTPVF